MDSRERMNRFLVEVFHAILRTEEACIREGGYQDLSVSEMHVIEAVSLGESEGKNSARDIAESLHITPGSLSVSLNVLETKGYLLRTRDSVDRRRVRITMTPKGRRANEDHERFHQKMIDRVMEAITPEEVAVFIRALEGIGEFFLSERARGRKSRGKKAAVREA